MSIAVAVLKGRTIAIAADTQENFGDRRVLRGDHASSKIMKVGGVVHRPDRVGAVREHPAGLPRQDRNPAAPRRAGDLRVLQPVLEADAQGLLVRQRPADGARQVSRSPISTRRFWSSMPAGSSTSRVRCPSPASRASMRSARAGPMRWEPCSALHRREARRRGDRPSRMRRGGALRRLLRRRDRRVLRQARSDASGVDFAHAPDINGRTR